ncbi:MAG: non-canonical purine NTP pyrophosphatase, partial [Bacilli bacterium]|nr:non-canonical purine NTP pyrophosphatase [Bacilli bacterium]
MKVLFATTNQAKVLKYKKVLEEHGIELITIKDLDFKLDIEENGKNAIENAYIKAKAYWDITHIPTIGMDNNLFIEELPDDKQPGTYVRRVNGKELTDDEMIMYYSNLVKEYGGKLTAKWVYGMVICNNTG